MAAVTDALDQLKWYVKRLSVMEPGEVLYRLREQCDLTAMQMQYSITRVAPRERRHDGSRLAFCVGAASKLPDLPWSFEPDDAAIAALLDGRGHALGYAWRWKDQTAVWHEAPDTGRRWPQSFFASIPYRAGNPYGDVRVAWEPSRLQHLVLLGLLAGRLEGKLGDEAATLLAAQLCSWVNANPAQQGIHYLSAMECALRIIALCHAVDLARGSLIALGQAEPVWQVLPGLIEDHAHFIVRRLSRHSSRGNHTIAEGAGLVYAGLLFPEWDGAARWTAMGMALLEQEADHQIARDGGGAEQSFRYLQSIVDLYGLVIALCAHHRRPVPGAILNGHARGLQFLNAFASCPDELPVFGDDDNGYALSPALRLSFQSGEEIQLPLTLPLDVRTFHNSGYTLIRDDDRQVAAIFDHGPLGMAPSYGHGHADALSVVVRRGREELLIDPGTYTYTGEARWRSYFHGTRAHNTVTVDGMDQAIQETPFMWSRPYTVTVVRREETPEGGFRLLARHDGYARLKPGVDHWRAVVCRPSGRWLIWDYLAGEGRHTLDLHWHCGIQPVTDLGVMVFPGRPQAVAMAVEGGEVTFHRGESDPICGWRSKIYGAKEPVTTVRARHCGALPHVFVTELWTGKRPPDAWAAECSRLRAWVEDGVHETAQG